MDKLGAIKRRSKVKRKEGEFHWESILLFTFHHLTLYNGYIIHPSFSEDFGVFSGSAWKCLQLSPDPDYEMMRNENREDTKKKQKQKEEDKEGNVRAVWEEHGMCD
ncbi:hypothetical protein LOAG_13819 [Loa loa]|uniref:Uncharacterized protein n=1 Tax=Loa loa TaxID=7209 RepID=A0A1S0TK65_LOALO|nr:hypothetical protein LOAG_13819 [Loa loa]EFO14697.1 hypothetical protein LOAG_13819 [Loa loa]